MKRSTNRLNCRKQGPRRLNTRTSGGNWQGKPYLSYAEHDRAMRYAIQDETDTYTRRSKEATRRAYAANVEVIHESRG